MKILAHYHKERLNECFITLLYKLYSSTIKHIIQHTTVRYL